MSSAVVHPNVRGMLPITCFNTLNRGARSGFSQETGNDYGPQGPTAAR